jgi:hypothetical protein
MIMMRMALLLPKGFTVVKYKIFLRDFERRDRLNANNHRHCVKEDGVG